MNIVGVDYSLTSPCVCICDLKKEFKFTNCKFFYLTYNKKFDIDIDNIRGDLHSDSTTDQQRYMNITSWVLRLLKEGDTIYMEGYSMGSTGMVFNIAENAGLLKHYLWKNRYDFTIVAPTSIKKYATGKGNANKQLLQDVFEETTGYYIKKKLSMTDKQWNPSSDIIDSYYICKYGHEQETKNVDMD